MSILSNTILAIVSASCPIPEVKNYSNIAWTDVDSNNVKVASNRCKTLYTKKHCLIKFHKIGFQEYKAICGKRE